VNDRGPQAPGHISGEVTVDDLPRARADAHDPSTWSRPWARGPGQCSSLKGAHRRDRPPSAAQRRGRVGSSKKLKSERLRAGDSVLLDMNGYLLEKCPSPSRELILGRVPDADYTSIGA